jgi:hypothetical protein
MPYFSLAVNRAILVSNCNTGIYSGLTLYLTPQMGPYNTPLLGYNTDPTRQDTANLDVCYFMGVIFEKCYTPSRHA